MSYCRWSSDNFNCDLYCYETENGFETNIAACRWRTWVRIFHFLTDHRVKVEGIVIRWNRDNRWFWRIPHRITHKAIRLPCAGKHFTDETEEAMFNRIRNLVKIGYRVPKDLLEEEERRNYWKEGEYK